MRRAAIALFLAAAACHKASSKLEGHWVGQSMKVTTSSEQAAADKFASALTIDFKGNQVVVKTQFEQLSGHYHVVREDKTSVVLVTDEGDSEQALTFDGDNTLRWAIEPERTVVLARK